jgi:hypothetical protein
VLFGLFSGRREPARVAPGTPSVTFVAGPDSLEVFVRLDPSTDADKQTETLGRLMAHAAELSPRFSEMVSDIVSETGCGALVRGFRSTADQLEKPMVSPTAVWGASE